MEMTTVVVLGSRTLIDATKIDAMVRKNHGSV
jgi:hypothetical protein